MGAAGGDGDEEVVGGTTCAEDESSGVELGAVEVCSSGVEIGADEGSTFAVEVSSSDVEMGAGEELDEITSGVVSIGVLDEAGAEDTAGLSSGVSVDDEEDAGGGGG